MPFAFIAMYKLDASPCILKYPPPYGQSLIIAEIKID